MYSNNYDFQMLLDKISYLEQRIEYLENYTEEIKKVIYNRLFPLIIIIAFIHLLTL